jgi:toxin ParE1/3/4
LKIEWLPQAVNTRDAQLVYIARDSARAARLVAVRLRDQVRDLARFPELGRVGRWRGTRELVISRTSLIVVYRVRPKLARIEIIRVLHSSQRWPIGAFLA